MNFKNWINDEQEPDSTAPSSNCGGLASDPPKPSFQELLKKWKDDRKQANFISNKGLGERGMGFLKSTTFKPVSAGETPTISHGIPVGLPTGMFK